MEAGHTPGPWTYTSPKFQDHYVVITGMCSPLGHVYGRDSSFRSTGEAMANVRLITASPDMLDALIAADKLMNHYYNISSDDEPMDETHDKVRAAIRKAKGE